MHTYIYIYIYIFVRTHVNSQTDPRLSPRKAIGRGRRGRGGLGLGRHSREGRRADPLEEQTYKLE